MRPLAFDLSFVFGAEHQWLPVVCPRDRLSAGSHTDSA